MTGPLALVGGSEWTEGCDFDASLLEAAGTDEVLVLPTAAAYENPRRAVERATAWFQGLGAGVRALPVLDRAGACDPAHADAVRSARFVYLASGSPLHLRSVLKDAPLWDALSAAWHAGTVVAGSGAGAMVLCDPMVDPRGGAVTVGLGLVAQLAVIPHHDKWSEDKAGRAVSLAPHGVAVAGISERAALIRDPDGTWRTAGAGDVVVFVDGAEAGLDALPG